MNFALRGAIPNPPTSSGGEIGEDVAEQVRGHDHVVLPRIEDELHRAGIHDPVVPRHLALVFPRHFAGDLEKHAVALSSGVNTKEGSRQIIEFAFDYAARNGRKKVTVVHKANVLKALTGVFSRSPAKWRGNTRAR